VLNGEAAQRLAQGTRRAAEEYLTQQVDGPAKAALGALKQIVDAVGPGQASYSPIHLGGDRARGSLNQAISDLAEDLNRVPEDIEHAVSTGGSDVLLPNVTRQHLANAEKFLQQYSDYSREESHPIRAVARVGLEGTRQLNDLLSEDALAENVLYPEADRHQL
jgi:hypothetical protein